MGITYEPFKGRSVAHGERVCVYRNLKFGDRVVWSIARATATGNRGEVVGHVQGCDGVALSDCVAREKGSRQAAIQTGADREVCAWVEGTLAGAPDSLSAGAGAHVTYGAQDARRILLRRYRRRFHGRVGSRVHRAHVGGGRVIVQTGAIDPREVRVAVYWNLSKRVWSIKTDERVGDTPKGKVIAYADSSEDIALVGARFVVNRTMHQTGLAAIPFT
jgi:hypothetical protein